MKERLLIWGDAPVVATGFGKVTKNLAERLSSDYEIGILGINYYGNEIYDTSKYFIYPVRHEDLMGFTKFEKIVEDFKPDKIFLMQDIYNIKILFDEHKDIFESIPTVIYFPVDGVPFSPIYRTMLKFFKNKIMFSEFAKRTVQYSGTDVSDCPIMYHGVDTSIFKPLDRQLIDTTRKGLTWDNKFIITNVNRFSPRKHVSQTLRIASMFINGYRECTECGNVYPAHLSECDLNCCSLERSMFVEGHPDAAVYLHMQIVDGLMGNLPTDLLTSHAMSAGFTGNQINRNIYYQSKNIYAKNGPTEEALNIIFNCSNVMLSTSYGEGFGLTTVEAMAAGIPVMVGRHTTNIELTSNGKFGYLINNSALLVRERDSAITRPIMDTKDALMKLRLLYKRWKIGESLVDYDRVDWINSTFNWDEKAAMLGDIIKKAV